MRQCWVSRCSVESYQAYAIWMTFQRQLFYWLWAKVEFCWLIHSIGSMGGKNPFIFIHLLTVLLCVDYVGVRIAESCGFAPLRRIPIDALKRVWWQIWPVSIFSMAQLRTPQYRIIQACISQQSSIFHPFVSWTVPYFQVSRNLWQPCQSLLEEACQIVLKVVRSQHLIIHNLAIAHDTSCLMVDARVFDMAVISIVVIGPFLLFIHVTSLHDHLRSRIFCRSTLTSSSLQSLQCPSSRTTWRSTKWIRSESRCSSDSIPANRWWWCGAYQKWTTTWCSSSRLSWTFECAFDWWDQCPW